MQNLPPRRIDQKTVRGPEYYGDTGGPGWFAELQHPRRARLALGYDARYGNNAWIDPLTIIISGLPFPIDLADLKQHFQVYGEIVC
jgi:hypothetical protein